LIRFGEPSALEVDHWHFFVAVNEGPILPAATGAVYLWTDEGWLYLAIALDLFNREVVGWSLKPRLTADIVIGALTMAWFRKKPAPMRGCTTPTGEASTPAMPSRTSSRRMAWSAR